MCPESANTSSIKVVSVQIGAAEEMTRDQRLARADEMLGELYAGGVRPAQILFPEIWATGFFAFDRYLEESEPEKGALYEMMSAWCRKLGCYIHTGSFVEKDGGNYYNTSLLLDPNGHIAGRYRKIHLFGYGSREKELLSPGSGISVVGTDYGQVGLATCYDLRFPELFRAMVDLGAQFFLVTSAWPAVRLEHWKLFNQIRALENQCFLFSCNAAGIQCGNELAGHSMIVDPLGRIISSGGFGEGFVTGQIDPAEAGRYRSSFPALADRRLSQAARSDGLSRKD